MSFDDETTANNVTSLIARDTAVGEPKVIQSERGAGQIVSVAMIVPDGYRLISTESLQFEPDRQRGSITLDRMDSFVSYVREQSDGRTKIYASQKASEIVAVLNDHVDSGGSGWRDYRAIYPTPLSVEWVAWMAANGRKMSQTDFARFVEDNLPDIRKPAAADMLEISRTLEAKKKVNFASGIRLSSGESELTYEEQITGTASKGKLKVPEEFSIGIPVYQGGPPYQVDARLRYRIGQDGALLMWYDLIRPHKIIEAAFSETVSAIGEALKVEVLYGTA